MEHRHAVLAILVAVAVLLPATAAAHWCSNIFAARARLVVKAEKTTVAVTGGQTATLKVFLQNNFPYRLFGVQMRGSASGYTITVSPSSQTVGPGQQVAFTYSISGSAGTLQASQMALQVRIRYGGWQGESDPYVDPNPSQAELAAASVYGSSTGDQSASLNAAVLADKYPTAQISTGPGFTGIEQLISWFGYRFCYNSGGSYRCGSQDCPSPCAEGTPWTATNQFPQNCMRAGVDLAIRRAQLGSQLTAARDGAVNAMKAGSNEHKCLAAVVGGHLWKGASSTATFENALDSVSAACKAAGLRALGKGTQSSCNSGAYYERAACAAAEGLSNNDGPVTSVLIPNAGDGDSSGSYDSLYYAYMLYLVAHDRYAQGTAPSFYPPVGAPLPDKGTTPVGDQGTGPQPDSGPPADLKMIVNEAGVTVPIYPDRGAGIPAGPSNTLTGGCRHADAPPPPATAVVLLLAVGLLLRRRRR
jgi:MYXO-CTERM domain-containing protein